MDVNERDRDGCTPLHVALINGQSECARLLVEAGAESFITLEGSPALHVAVSTAAIPHFLDASAEAVAMLLENDAEALATDDYGRSALHLAAGIRPGQDRRASAGQVPGDGRGEGDEDAPDPISARDKYGWTPLHHACFGGHAEVAESLLARGSKPEKPNKVGQTSLHAPSSAATRRPSRRCSRRMLHWPARRATTGKPRSIWRRRGGTP